MKPADFDTGDGFNEPFTSGYYVLHERIIDDMCKNPADYKPWEIAFLADVPAGCYKDYWKDVEAYIDDWCEARSESVYF